MKTCACGKVLANNAATCPDCGKQFTSRVTIMIGIVLVLIIIIPVLVALSR